VDVNHSSGRNAKEKVPACNGTYLPDPHMFGGAEFVPVYPKSFGSLVREVRSNDRSPVLARETTHGGRKEIPPHTSPPQCLGRSWNRTDPLKFYWCPYVP